jgi:PPOX class probable F420-dependent enzyme
MTEAASAGERHGVGAVRTVRGKYLNITSYKRNGTAVATPVWFVEQGGRLLVETDAASGKVKRIRHNPAVLVAECSASGRLRGDQLSAVAELLPSPKSPGLHRLVTAKYRADLVVIGPLRALQVALHPDRPRTRSVILSITLS